jgi:hypothetical protein
MGMAVVAVTLFVGCAANFAGKVPVSPKVQFISGNETLDAAQYEVKGVVVVQRVETFFDIFGLIKPMNRTLERVFTEDIANELSDKVIELGANAAMNREIVSFSYVPGIYLPIGSASVTVQATAIKLR